MAVKVSDPSFDNFFIRVPDFQKSTVRALLEQLLRLFVNERRFENGVSLVSGWKGSGAGDDDAQVIGGSNGEVDKEVQVVGSVSFELEGCDWDVVSLLVLWRSFEGGWSVFHVVEEVVGRWLLIVLYGL